MPPIAKEVARPQRHQEITALSSKRGELAIDGVEGEPALFPIEKPDERLLSPSRCPRVSLTESPERNGALRQRRKIDIGRERIAHANVVIEIGERLYPQRIRDVGFDNDGEPEAQLAEPDSCWILVDAENRARQHVPPNI